MNLLRPAQYTDWTKADLISRINVLEAKSSSSSSTPALPKYPYSSHPRQKIALKFCYSGWLYGGLAYQNERTPLPTVEQTLFDALVKTRLVDPEGGFEGCAWDRCGRTDRGVSAAGQVVSLWVRSAVTDRRVKKKKRPVASEPEPGPASDENESTSLAKDGLPGVDEFDFGPPPPADSSSSSEDESDLQQELPYVTLLNRVLPSSIRVIAWAPVSPSFSARFRCRYRHYKYFFSAKHLSIPLMREAASYLVGKHDFRNLCKVDAAKQIVSFKRRIHRADIVPVPEEIGAGGTIWVFNLIGSAFLYHQVRHIMAVLLLVGAGLEKPLIMKQLMHVCAPPTPHRHFNQDEDDGPSSEEDDTLREEDGFTPLRNKPEYQMADGLPLMLWDCAYPDADLSWRRDPRPPSTRVPIVYDEVPQSTESLPSSSHGCVVLSGDNIPELPNLLSSLIQRNQIETALNAHFLYAAHLSGLYKEPPTFQPVLEDEPKETVKVPDPQAQTMNVPVGGGSTFRASFYVPVMKKKRLNTVEEINGRWAKGKGARRIAKGKPDEGEELDGTGE
ncbi:pseudouridine synthase [Flagelloscypha sp. PMI_526]|nr:pseudouridine synthase [Flagelloscypha sp. PMI_526]